MCPCGEETPGQRRMSLRGLTNGTLFHLFTALLLYISQHLFNIKPMNLDVKKCIKMIMQP